jgi:hypothetical protein
MLSGVTTLDPNPTIFGTGRIDPLVAPDGSTEYSRAIQWINDRAARTAFGSRLRIALLGDPIAAYNLRAAFQPLIDWRNDLMGDPYEDFDYDDPTSNWGPNQ